MKIEKLESDNRKKDNYINRVIDELEEWRQCSEELEDDLQMQSDELEMLRVENSSYEEGLKQAEIELKKLYPIFF